MDNREVAIGNMAKAFTLWEERFRDNPEHFMDDATMKAKTPGDLGEVRAIYMAGLLDEVRAEGTEAAPKFVNPKQQAAQRPASAAP